MSDKFLKSERMKYHKKKKRRERERNRIFRDSESFHLAAQSLAKMFIPLLAAFYAHHAMVGLAHCNPRIAASRW
jgi:hypothetical protein